MIHFISSRLTTPYNLLKLHQSPLIIIAHKWSLLTSSKKRTARSGCPSEAATAVAGLCSIGKKWGKCHTGTERCISGIQQRSVSWTRVANGARKIGTSNATTSRASNWSRSEARPWKETRREWTPPSESAPNNRKSNWHPRRCKCFWKESREGKRKGPHKQTPRQLAWVSIRPKWK